MKKKSLTLVMAIVFMFSTAAFVGCGGNGGDGKKTIEIDGGGDTGQFNTTASMEVSEANPFPYNTLETLCNEWMETHPDYNVVIRQNSIGGNRQSLTSLLSTKSAPDIIYQNGAIASQDLGKGWYVPLREYFDDPNPYNENKPWSEVWQPGELDQDMQADGENYYVCMERNSIGIIYNKKMFAEANIDWEIETFGDLMLAQKAISEHYGSADSSGIVPYIASNNWLDICLETNMYSHLLETCDTLRTNGRLDTEEYCRAYKKGYWTLEDERYEEFVRLMKLSRSYYPTGWRGYDGVANFARGNVAMLAGQTKQLRMVLSHPSLAATGLTSEDIGFIGFPYLSAEDPAPYGTQYAEKATRRGSAGLSTAWWISNAAIKKDTVDACVDLLMFLTAPENNNRMIGDMKGAIPLDLDAEIDPMLTPLRDMYREDLGDSDRVAWAASTCFLKFGLDYQNKFIKDSQSMDVGGNLSESDFIQGMIDYTEITVNTLILEMEYDQTKW